MIWAEAMSVVRRRWKSGLLTFCVVVGVGMLLHLLRPVRHEARIWLAVEQPSQEIFAVLEGGAVPARYLSLYTRASRIRTPAFAREVAAALAAEGSRIPEEEVLRTLHLRGQESPDLFVISAEHPDSGLASRIARTAARLFAAEREQRARREARQARLALDRRVGELEKNGGSRDRALIETLRVKLEEYRVVEETRPGDVVLLDEEPKVRRLKREGWREALALGFFGVLLGGIVILAGEAGSPTVARLGEVRALLPAVPVWRVRNGVSPALRGVARTLRNLGIRDGRVRAGRVVALVGLSQGTDTGKWAECLGAMMNGSMEKVMVIGPDRPEPGEGFFEEYRRAADLVLVNLLPVPAPRSYLLAGEADGVLFVLEAGTVTREELAAEAGCWRDLSLRPLGVLLAGY